MEVLKRIDGSAIEAVAKAIQILEVRNRSITTNQIKCVVYIILG